MEGKAFGVRVSGYSCWFWFDYVQNVDWFMEMCGEAGKASWAFKRNELGQYERYACYVMDEDGGGYVIKMPDSDKVIKGLQCIIDGTVRCESCGYAIDKHGHHSCQQNCAADAIALLKEQEAVKPILEQDSMVCGVCGHEVIWQKMLGDGIWADEELDYCPHCGRKVKWDD